MIGHGGPSLLSCLRRVWDPSESVRTRRLRFTMPLLVLLAGLGSAAAAAPVSAESVRTAVGRWTTRCPAAHMKSRMNRRVASVKTFRSDGEEVFHVVSLDGGGFVVASADDRIEPVIAFAEDGEFSEDGRNPLWRLLMADLSQRLKAHRDGRVKTRDPTRLRGRGSRRRWRPPAEEWGELLTNVAPAVAMTAAAPSLSQPADVRVDTLVQSTWNQSVVAGLPCYNYYTPNGYVCGCVATAGAQLMRFHRHPAAAVTPREFACQVNGVSMTMSMMGGVYDWDAMPLRPDSSMTDAQRQAIGRICYDAGVASRMRWTSGESSAMDVMLAQSLVEVFGYANAKCEMNQDTGIGADLIEDAVYANLDAGYPVLLGILTDTYAGHEIVADGYGVYNGTVYTHLNLGWSGTGNAWYALPSVSAGGYEFTALGSVVYNVFPGQTGEILSGRVTDTDGLPIADAAVTASYTVRSGFSSKKVTREDVTDANGIYAVIVDSGSSCTVSATKPGYAAVSATVAVGTSKTTRFEAASGGYYPGTGVVGNRWGNDLALVESAKSLAGIEIRGPSMIYRSTRATYVCAATFGDGSVRPVQAVWRLSSGSSYASIDGASGILSAASPSKDSSVGIFVRYAEYGVTKTATKSITVAKSDPRPANDSFAGAVRISGPSGRSTAVNGTNSTDESGDPLLAFEPSAVGTLWWRWTAPDDGTVSLSAADSGFPAVVGAYAGTGFDRLIRVAEGREGCEFACTKGTDYAIAVGGWCGTRGNTVLTWSFAPRRGFSLLIR